MTARTPYQEKIIKRYYDNREDIMQQRLTELTSDLYLSEGKKRAQIWKRISAALATLGVPDHQIEQLVNMDNPSRLAQFLEKRVP